MGKSLEDMAEQESMRVIPDVLRVDGFMTMAMHEFLTTLNVPALMISHFEPSTVSYGKFVDWNSLPEECKTGKTPSVRRKSGGEILMHDSSDVTYAIAGVPNTGLVALGWLMDGLDKLGISTRVNRGTSIFVRGHDGYRKIAGSARYKAVNRKILMHGSLFYDRPDFSLMERIYRVSQAELQKNITYVREHTDASLQTVYQALRDGFSQGRRYHMQPFTDQEMAVIKELALEYASEAHARGSGLLHTGQPCVTTLLRDHKKHVLPDSLRGRTIYDE